MKSFATSAGCLPCQSQSDCAKGSKRPTADLTINQRWHLMDSNPASSAAALILEKLQEEIPQTLTSSGTDDVT